MRKSFLIAVVAFFWPLSVLAQSIDLAQPLEITPESVAEYVEKGQSICYEVQNFVNVLVDYTQTTCLPAGGKAGALSFIVISSQPVFSVEASKKAWLLVVVGIIGKTLNEQLSFKADRLWVSDANLMERRTGYFFPIALAKSLQHQAYNGQIDLEGMYAAIKKNLVQKTIPK